MDCLRVLYAIVRLSFMFHIMYFVLWLAYLIHSSKVLRVGGKQNPYQMWQAGISLASSPLSNSSRSPAMESAARPPSHPASYAGYVFHAPCFPRPVLSTPCAFQTLCFPHPVFSTPGVFHTPCFPSDPVFSTPHVFNLTSCFPCPVFFTP